MGGTVAEGLASVRVDVCLSLPPLFPHLPLCLPLSLDLFPFPFSSPSSLLSLSPTPTPIRIFSSSPLFLVPLSRMFICSGFADVARDCQNNLHKCICAINHPVYFCLALFWRVFPYCRSFYENASSVCGRWFVMTCQHSTFFCLQGCDVDFQVTFTWAIVPWTLNYEFSHSYSFWWRKTLLSGRRHQKNVENGTGSFLPSCGLTVWSCRPTYLGTAISWNNLRERKGCWKLLSVEFFLALIFAVLWFINERTDE